MHTHRLERCRANAFLWVKYAFRFMRFVGPGARQWHRPSWRMWLTRSTGAQAGILTEPGVLSQWVERGWRRCHTPRVQKLQLHVHQLARLKKLGTGVWIIFFLFYFFLTCITVSWWEYGSLDINHHAQSHRLLFVVRARFCEINCRGWGEEKKRHFPITRDEAIKGQHVWKSLMYYFSEACVSLLLKWNNLVRHLLFLHGGIYCWPMSAHCNPWLEHGCITSVTYSWSS